jgi:hypothetical protein
MDMIAGPICERPHPRIDLGKFGNEGIVGINGRSQVADQVLKELLAGALSDSLDEACSCARDLTRHGSL